MTDDERHADDAGDGEDADPGADGETYAVLLDYLPNGRADDDRPQYEKSPVGYALGEREFRLFELTFADEAGVNIADRVVVEPEPDPDVVSRMRTIEYDDLTRGATQELDYAIEELIERDERRFVDFYNDAQPITLRLHQLNLLPGIGKKLRNNVLDERKRGPFESFEELEDRVSGLHRPKEVLVERILEELRDDDLKYRTFVGADSSSGE